MAANLFQIIYYTSILAFVLGNSLDNLQKTYAQYVMECAKDYPITADDIEQLRKRELPDKETVKCLFACAYKRAGMMDDEGKMSVSGTKEIIQKYLSDDPSTLKKANDFTEACKSVNDEAVGDGTKGCDRAALMFHCSIEKANEVWSFLSKYYFNGDLCELQIGETNFMNSA